MATYADTGRRSLKRGITRSVNSGYTKNARGAATPTTGQLWPRGGKRSN
jgi:hypothetical protein